mgnify:CR=1 FL=1
MAEITTASPNQDLEANLERIRIARDRGLLARAESPGVGAVTPGVYNGDPLFGLEIGVAPSDITRIGTGVAPSVVDKALSDGVGAAQYANREQEKGNFLENLLGQIDLNKLLNSKTVKLLLEGVAGMSGEQQRSGGSALSGFTTSLNQARADDQQAMLNEQDRLLEQSRYDASAAASQAEADYAARRADMAETRRDKKDAREATRFSERNNVNPVSLNKPTENFIKDMISNSRIVSAIVEERDGTWYSRNIIGTSPTESEVINAIVSEVVKIQHSNRVPLAQAFSAYEQSVGSPPSSSNTSDESVASETPVNFEDATMQKEPSE